MKIRVLYAAVAVLVLVGTSASIVAQSSVGSLAEFTKKQDDGIAETVRLSRDRARSGKLVMGGTAGNKGGKLPSQASDRPAVIRVGVHPRQTGHDNRRQNNVR